MEQLIREKISEAVNLKKHTCRDAEVSGVSDIHFINTVYGKDDSVTQVGNSSIYYEKEGYNLRYVAYFGCRISGTKGELIFEDNGKGDFVGIYDVSSESFEEDSIEVIIRQGIGQ